MAVVKCSCGKVIFDGTTLKCRVAQFNKARWNVKCSQCKSWLTSLKVGILTGEIDEDVIIHDTRRIAL